MGRVKQIAAALFLIAAVVLSEAPSYAFVEPAWRTFGRQGSILLHERKYAQAVEEFQKASAALPSAEKREDVRLDLLLSQAEAYRLWGQFESCGEILDQVKRDLKKGEACDPTIGARYWRRRADLMLSLGRNEEMISAFRQQLAVTLKFFDRTSDHYLSVCETIAMKLYEAKNYDVLGHFLRDAFEQMSADAEFQKVISNRFRPFFGQLRAEAGKLAIENSMARSKFLITTLQQIDPEKSDLGDVWLQYVGRGAMRKDITVLSNDTTDRITELARFYKQHPTPTNLHQEIVCHIALEFMYRETKQYNLSDLQALAIVNAIEKLLPNNASDFEKILVLGKYYSETEDAKVDSKSSAALKTLRTMVELTPMPPRIGFANEERKNAYGKYHIVGRLRLARLCSRMGLMDEAEKAISSIREGPIEKEYPLAQTHVMVAEGYFEAGNLAECKRHLQIAEQMGELGADFVARANRIKERLAKFEQAPK